MTGEPAAADRLTRVTAVVLIWNTAELAIHTLKSLADGYAAGLRIILVDNGSVDDSVAVIRAFLERWEHSAAVTFVSSPENLGFPGGVNLGAEAALAAEPPPDYIWLLNPDAAVTAETVSEMVEVARESGAGIVSAREGDPGIAGLGRWPRPFYLRPRDFMVLETPDRWVETARCAAWCALVDVSLIRELIERDGHFQNASLYLDWDEWDLSLRATTLGWTSVAALRAPAVHETSGRTHSAGPMAAARQYYRSRNSIAVARRFIPWWMFWPVLLVHFARDVTWLARLRMQGFQPNFRAYASGAVDGLRGKSGRWDRHPVTPSQRMGGQGGARPAWAAGPEPLSAGIANVTAVVLTWNTADLAIQTLKSLAGGYPEGLRVVLVDNGSIDDSVTVIQEFLDGWQHAASVTFLRSRENLGFPGGVNFGVAAALESDPSPDYVWMLNPDAVVSAATAREMVAVAREIGAPIVSSGAPDETYVAEDTWPQVVWARPQTIDRPMPRNLRWWRVGRYTGASALFDARLVRELLRRDGHFQDQELFLDWDEWDTTRRAASLGAFVVHARDAEFSHPTYARYLGTSPMAATRQYYMSRNEVIVGRRYMPWWTFWLFLPVHVGRDLTWFLRLRRHGEMPHEGAYLRGLFDGLLGNSGKWKHHPLTPAETIREAPESAGTRLQGSGSEARNLHDVTVVIVVWNSAELAMKALDSLAGAFAAGLRAVVVDNDSADGSGAAIETFLDGWPQAEHVTLLRSSQNLGFTGGVNFGTEVALSADPPPAYIWLLNPDAVVNPETIRELLFVAAESGAGIVSASGGMRQKGKGAGWPRTFWWPLLRDDKALPAERWWRSNSYAGSCVIFEAALVRRLIERDGQFQDNALFMYWDERDTMLRAASFGALAVFSRDAPLQHSGGDTRGKSNAAGARQYYLSRNSILVARRHLAWWQFVWMLSFHLARDFVWLARLWLQGEGPNIRAYLSGVVDGLRGRSGKWVRHPESPDANA